MTDKAEPGIFVSIAAYRDRDCQATLDDMMAKARHPGRVHVGICWQAVPGLDDAYRPRGDHLRLIEVDARKSLGACWARRQVQTLWRGEGHVLQIDAHMRFVEDWDVRLPAMLARCPSQKPVLSHYPSAFTPPDRIDSHIVSTLHATGFDADGILTLGSIGHVPDKLPGPPRPTAFLAAGFLFGDSRMLTEVPYDPYIYFQGEEIALAARLFTHGFDLFAPSDVLLYHDYNDHPARPRHWDDHPDWTRLHELSVKRVRHLLGQGESDDPGALVEIESYGLGQERSLAEYQTFCGVDFKLRTIDGRTEAEIRASRPADERRRLHRETFSSIWRNNGWGAEETRSGAGATLAATETVRAELPALFRRLGIKSLADAGCGEMHWMGLISGGLDFYFGLDLVTPLLDRLRQCHGRRPGHFFADFDVTLDVPPPADLVVCRDVLTLLPAAEIKDALARFAESGARYLLATTYPRGDNVDIVLGGWQAVDLCAEPFCLPMPQLLIPERPDPLKSLGLWPISDLIGRV